MELALWRKKKGILRKEKLVPEPREHSRACPGGAGTQRGWRSGHLEKQGTCRAVDASGKGHGGLACRPRGGLSWRNQLPSCFIRYLQPTGNTLKCYISQGGLIVRAVTNKSQWFHTSLLLVNFTFPHWWAGGEEDGGGASPYRLSETDLLPSKHFTIF